MNHNLLNELSELLIDTFESISGSQITVELFDNLAIKLNESVHALYNKYGMKSNRTIDREFVIYMFNILVEDGTIQISKNMDDGTTNNQINDTNTDNTPEYESNISYESANHIQTLKTLWQNFINNRQFVEAESILAAINSLTSTNASLPNNEFTNNNEISLNWREHLPENWGDNLYGNFDGSHWAKEFKVLIDLNAAPLRDEAYLTSWFANAIMTGYDKAKQEEFPVIERGEEDYFYVEFYDIEGDSVLGHSSTEISEVTFKFQTLAAAKEFVKLNGFGENFKSKYYRYFQLEPTKTFKKTEIK